MTVLYWYISKNKQICAHYEGHKTVEHMRGTQNKQTKEKKTTNAVVIPTFCLIVFVKNHIEHCK